MEEKKDSKMRVVFYLKNKICLSSCFFIPFVLSASLIFLGCSPTFSRKRKKMKKKIKKKKKGKKHFAPQIKHILYVLV